MIEIIRINSSHKHYQFIEELMKTAFPHKERRDSLHQQKLVEQNSRFYNNIILDNSTPIGILTYWDLETFIFIEHFAIDYHYRNKGYGSKALSNLLNHLQRPIILEAEKPTSELSSRRINFYKRQGFIVQDFPYLQPPYREGDEWFPLLLMSYGFTDIEIDYTNIRNSIYREVYKKEATF